MVKKQSASLAQKLKKAYFNPESPGSYGGKDRLYRSLHLTNSEKSKAEQWLAKTDSYTLYRPTRKRFQRRRTLVGGIDQCWQIDLTILDAETAQENDGVKYIMFVIDVFSKYAWARTLKRKGGVDITKALQDIIHTDKRSPYSIQSDKGKEFLNSIFQNFLNENNIHHYTTENDDIKASIVERLQRTIKERLQRYYTHNNSKKFADDLQKFMKSYNNSFHRTIKMNPSEVTPDTQELVWNQTYIPVNPFDLNLSKNVLKVGSTVRISKTRGVFQKGYLGNWSEEIFTVVKKVNSSPVTYQIVDEDGERIAGTWYGDELQKVTVNSEKIFKIESIVGTRKLGKRVQYLVKWAGYPSKFNSYVDKRDLVKYNN